MLALSRLLLAVIVLSAGFVVAAEAQTAPAKATHNLNLRADAGTQFRKLATIPAGREVQVLGCAGDLIWCNVSYQNQIGWVSARYLAPRPTAALPPTPVAAGKTKLPEGVVDVVGTLTGEGVECHALRGDDGKLYTLASTGSFKKGDRVQVRGTVAEMSFCMQGVTINPVSIVAAP